MLYKLRLLVVVFALATVLVSQSAFGDSTGQITRQNPVRGETSSFAGSGQQGDGDGPGSQATFSFPHGIVFDAANGMLYVTDVNNNKIRQVAPDGTVSTLAGSGKASGNDGQGAQAGFNHPSGITWDPHNGNLYVADTAHQAIREITVQGTVRTIAGSGREGRADGTGPQATFSYPVGITYNSVDHSLYVADTNNNEIRKVTLDGVVTTLAGGPVGFADAVGTEARFTNPNGITFDPTDGNLYVCDWGNERIRRVTPAGVVSTLAGNGKDAVVDGTSSAAEFLAPSGIAYNQIDGYLYVAEHGAPQLIGYLGIPTKRAMPSAVRRISPTTGDVTTIAGNGSRGYAEGVGVEAQFFALRGITVNAATGVLYVTDAGNQRIREIK